MIQHSVGFQFYHLSYQKKFKKAVVEHVYANYLTINLCHPNRLKMKMLKINSLLNQHQNFMFNSFITKV